MGYLLQTGKADFLLHLQQWIVKKRMLNIISVRSLGISNKFFKARGEQWMSYDYSENILVQEVAGNLLENELGWDVKFAYNTEVLGENGTFGRKSYKDIL